MDADVEISKPGESSHSVAAKDVKITTTKRHPAVANGIWLSRRLNSADGASKVDNVDTVSPIFHGYKVTRRLQKTGPSIPPMGREVLEKLMFKETGQTKDVYVKVPPFGAGKFVEGRVWDPALSLIHI